MGFDIVEPFLVLVLRAISLIMSSGVVRWDDRPNRYIEMVVSSSRSHISDHPGNGCIHAGVPFEY